MGGEEEAIAWQQLIFQATRQGRADFLRWLLLQHNVQVVRRSYRNGEFIYPGGPEVLVDRRLVSSRLLNTRVSTQATGVKDTGVEVTAVEDTGV